MKYKQSQVYVLCVVLSFSQSAFAQKSSSTSAEAPSATAVQINKSTQATPVQSGTIAKPTSSPSPAPSINNAAKKSQSMNMVSGIVSGVVGAGMMTMGYFNLQAANACSAAPPCVSAPLYGLAVMNFAMGAMALQQSATNFMSSGGASGTAGSTASYNSSGWGNIGENVGADPLANPALRDLIDVNKVKQGIAEAKKLGIDGKSPVKINGKEYSASDLSSPQAMAAAGISPDLIKSAMATAGKLEKEAAKRLGAHTAAMGYEEGGGSASASAASSNYNTDSSPTYSGTGRVPRDPASINVAGLTKNFNGDPIGVAADSIFQMMTRRYKLKEKQNSFIENTATNFQK